MAQKEKICLWCGNDCKDLDKVTKYNTNGYISHIICFNCLILITEGIAKTYRNVRKSGSGEDSPLKLIAGGKK